MAALDYLNDLHAKYNDWWYSILAYANSPTSLSHALIHYGAEPELWDFYEQRLMPDTRVIADFIACVYLGNQDKLNFSAKAVETSVVKPKKEKVPEQPLSLSKGVEGPTQKLSVSEPKKDPSTGSGSSKSSGSNKGSGTIKHIIKQGDTLSKIAAKYHVSVADLKKWNNLKNDNIFEGQTLIIKK